MPTVQTELLDIDYRDDGPREGKAVLLLHGWPDDATMWDGVAARLQPEGMRTIVPSLRGFGPTRFRNDTTPRTGDSAVLALDAIALMDAIGIARFHVAGHDWGANVAEALAVGWPDRVLRLAMLATPPRLGGMPTPPFPQDQRYWYHWFMATARGAKAVEDDPKGFAHLHWHNWGPPGWFDEATFERVAKSWDNPDFVPVTLHSYRSRWDEAAPDPRGAWLDAKVKETSKLSLPTMFFYGEADGVTMADSAAHVPAKFDGRFDYIALPGVGHFIPREAPGAVADKLIALFTAEEPGVVESAVDKVGGLMRGIVG